MEQDRQTSQVVMSIQKATLLMDPFFKLAFAGTAFLITYLARMAKEGKISRGEFDSVQEFMKSTEGKYAIVNIPYDKEYSPWEVQETIVDGKERYTIKNISTGETIKDKNDEVKLWVSFRKAEKEVSRLNYKESLSLDELKELGIKHVILPDLNPDDGMVQIALANEDRDKYVGWQERYLTNRMEGGEHSFRDIRNLTNGSTALISIPVEGAELEKLKQDFRDLKVNYAILPDLNVGDGETQFVIANSDLSNVEFWYKMYCQDMVGKGIDPQEMKTVTMSTYRNTGEMTEEQYVDTACDELKKANLKYEGAEPGVVERMVQRESKKVLSETDEKFVRYDMDSNYQKISIDYESCIQKSHLSDADKQKALDNGLFYSRIPGTWYTGDNTPELTLLLPSEQVFSANNGNTYYAFLKKDEKPVVLGGDGKPIRIDRRMTGKELYEKHYDKVTREFQNKTPVEIYKGTEKAKKIIKDMAYKSPVK